MSRILSSRQAEELHKSIIAYLSANSLPNTAAVLRTELGLGEDVFDATTATKYETLLEKKWTSVIRLQKKIIDLESRITRLQSELDNATPSSLSRRNQDPTSWLPSKPSRYTLESHQYEISCVAFHPVYSTIASGDQGSTIKIWDWELGELEKTIKGHTEAITGVDFGGPKGHILLASCSSDMTIKLWDPADGYKNTRTLSGHDHTISAVSFMPSGNMLVSASRDATLRIWDVTTGYCVKTIRGHSGWVRDVCPSPDGSLVLSTGDDQTVRLWNISGSQSENKLTMFGHENFIDCCIFAPPSSYQYLASLAGLQKPPPTSSTSEFMTTGSRDKTIKLWDKRGICFKTLVGHDNWVRALVFHPGGKYLLSVADDKALRCWDLSQDGKCVKELPKLHDHFVSCLKWAPVIVKDKDRPSTNG
ncbi:WD40-repeat-containing domain protein [Leptodontidium sp. 2 PMI_412]|nr:WD40-repeat-containing domain protein [Leptodontidium sp. 2 PMI_412]